MSQRSSGYCLRCGKPVVYDHAQVCQELHASEGQPTGGLSCPPAVEATLNRRVRRLSALGPRPGPLAHLDLFNNEASPYQEQAIRNWEDETS